MKTMKDFAAQQLTKKQMNLVQGGRLCGPFQYEFNCTFKIRGGESVSGRVCASDGLSAVIKGGLMIETAIGKGMVMDQTCLS